MRIEKEYKKAGYFWLPENSDNKIPGTLTITDGGEIELEVVGTFDESIETAFDSNVHLIRIIGNVEDDGYVTLERCFYTSKSIAFGGISRSYLHVSQVLCGVAYDKDEEVTFNTLSFSIECMDEWIGISGIEVTTEFTPYIEHISATIKYTPPASISYLLNNGMQLEICFAYTLPSFSNVTEAKITQRTYFKLISDELCSLHDFTSIAYKITNLLCFAVDSTVSIKGLTATSNEIMQDVGNGKNYAIPIKVYYPSNPFTEKKPKVHSRNMIFTFGIIKENAGDVFNKWIDSYDSLAPALGLYFSTKMDVHKYLDGKFLALAQGLETYHRRISHETLMDDSEFQTLVQTLMQHCPKDKKEWLDGRLKYGNEINFGKRIKKMIEPFKEHIGNNCTREKIIRKIVSTRNYLTHYNEDLKEETARGKDLWILCKKIETIFQLHFLNEIGFTQSEISQVIENNNLLKQKLDESFE